jgi:cytochrome c553
MQYRRKLLIRQWQKHCKERAATSEKLMLLLHDSNMSEQSLYYFDLTVSMAEQAALNELSQGQSISA